MESSETESARAEPRQCRCGYGKNHPWMRISVIVITRFGMVISGYGIVITPVTGVALGSAVGG